MRIYILLSIYLLCQSLFAQKYNHQWPYGYGSNLPLSFGFSMIDFNNQSVTISVLGELDNFEFGYNGSFICDKNGQLQLMTNNCAIRDRNFNIIENGDTLTPGYTWENYCADGGDYPSSNCTLFLPELSNDSVFYLLHKDANLSSIYQDVICQNFYLSTIVKKQNGKFYIKSKVKIKSGVMGAAKLTATRNSDGTKWWTFVTDFNSNKFYAFEIGGAEVLTGPVISTLGIPITSLETQLAQVCFSTDSKVLAINNSPPIGVMLYDFDNQTGVFSNYRSINYQNIITNDPDGVAFSPNNRFLYLTAARHIWQIDMLSPSAGDAVFDMGEVSIPDETGWPIGVGTMYLGPDCRIYVGPGTSTYYIHVIHNPNQKCPDCNFEIKAIRSPTRLKFDLPNTINYLPNGQCDSTIAWGIVETNTPPNYSPELLLHPNPANYIIAVSTQSTGTIDIEIYDMSGLLVAKKSKIANGDKIDVSGLPNGIYLYIATIDGFRKNGKISVVR